MIAIKKGKIKKKIQSKNFEYVSSPQLSILRFKIKNKDKLKQKCKYKKTLKIASIYTGVGSFEHSLIKNNIKHKIIFIYNPYKKIIEENKDKKFYYDFISQNYKINNTKFIDEKHFQNNNTSKDQIDIIVIEQLLNTIKDFTHIMNIIKFFNPKKFILKLSTKLIKKLKSMFKIIDKNNYFYEYKLIEDIINSGIFIIGHSKFLGKPKFILKNIIFKNNNTHNTCNTNPISYFQLIGFNTNILKKDFITNSLTPIIKNTISVSIFDQILNVF